MSNEQKTTKRRRYREAGQLPRYPVVGLRPETYQKLLKVASMNRWTHGETVDALLDEYLTRHHAPQAAAA